MRLFVPAWLFWLAQGPAREYAFMLPDEERLKVAGRFF